MFLHLDMNSYFASVEQQANPLWRNKPLAVCAYLSRNGCILASSIEAKKLGIRTGCTINQAKKLCPQIILVENKPYKYLSTTKNIFNILKKYSDKFEPYSIDEGFLDLTGWQNNYLEAEKLAGKIRNEIKTNVGTWLKCSVGIAPTKFLAKLASDTAGKDETLVINDNLDQILSGLKLTDVWGIGKKLAERLHGLNIYTPLEFKYYPLENIITTLGNNGYYLWAGLNGQHVSQIKTNEEAVNKSIGHSYCLPNKTTELGYLESVLFKLCQKTGRRLREQKFFASHIWAGYVCVNGDSYWFRQTLDNKIDTTVEIFYYAKKCFNKKPIENVRMLAMSVSKLSSTVNQLSLFQQKNAIDKTIDEINDKFGDLIIQRGRIFGLEKQAQFRIGFRKTIDINFKD